MSMNINTLPVMIILGTLAAIAVTVLLYIFVLPEKKKEKLPKVVKIIHDIFSFKELYLEKIFRALYVFSTVACITIGACMFLGIEIYSSSYGTYTDWYGGYGILLMLAGPVALRISFEAVMMFILLVKNVIQINNKLKAADADEEKEVVKTVVDDVNTES